MLLLIKSIKKTFTLLVNGNVLFCQSFSISLIFFPLPPNSLDANTPTKKMTIVPMAVTMSMSKGLCK